ncbi:hypothetical protein BCR43DRAFT_485226 [Syncephalastrum racemosum]|uniref:Uncharacterized protein n=1 Tax=Syncephalastrum racemosum TaxID=13706 RepID=A0A1X2HMD4_SYNRA|nr:hypothetical protein BCR43DRAFT_485226 [Syncephalastrum racemosum]
MIPRQTINTRISPRAIRTPQLEGLFLRKPSQESSSRPHARYHASSSLSTCPVRLSQSNPIDRRRFSRIDKKSLATGRKSCGPRRPTWRRVAATLCPLFKSDRTSVIVSGGIIYHRKTELGTFQKEGRRTKNTAVDP